ncbi:asialoglycoprotein receptor 1-like [Rhynchonycteris naso]
MSMKYEDLQSLEGEKKSQVIRNGLPSAQASLRHLCSGPCPLLLSLSISFLLLVSICVIGSKTSKNQRDLETLTENYSNFTSDSVAEIRALHSQDGTLRERIKFLNAEVEKHKQELQAARSLNDKVFTLESMLEKGQQDLEAGYSQMLLRVQQLTKDLNFLYCQMAALKSNGSLNTCCPVNWLEYEGSCYWFSRTRKPWLQAGKYCQLVHAHLVVVNSMEEQVFLKKHTSSLNTWIGLTDQNGTWTWVDGTDYNSGFQNWSPEQPDNWSGHGLGGGEDCAHFTYDGHWNDNVCTRPFRWVCETRAEQSRKPEIPDYRLLDFQTKRPAGLHNFCDSSSDTSTSLSRISLCPTLRIAAQQTHESQPPDFAQSQASYTLNLNTNPSSSFNPNYNFNHKVKIHEKIQEKLRKVNP